MVSPSYIVISGPPQKMPEYYSTGCELVVECIDQQPPD